MFKHMSCFRYCFLTLALVFSVFFSFSASAESEIYDPIESVNRGIFWFNDQFDIYLLEPVARGYDYIAPDPIQEGINNFFNNLGYPQYLVSDLVQLKFGQALEHTGRFILNSTIGVAGFVDVAKHLGLEHHREDFGLALAYHGVPAGPYIVLPFLGPSNLRDGIGLLVDTALDPTYWLAAGDILKSNEEWIVSGSTTTLKFVHQRAQLFEAIETAKESSLDYYLFMQSAYYQHREGLLNDGVILDDDLWDDEEF